MIKFVLPEAELHKEKEEIAFHLKKMTEELSALNIFLHKTHTEEMSRVIEELNKALDGNLITGDPISIAAFYDSNFQSLTGRKLGTSPSDPFLYSPEKTKIEPAISRQDEMKIIERMLAHTWEPPRYFDNIRFDLETATDFYHHLGQATTISLTDLSQIMIMDRRVLSLSSIVNLYINEAPERASKLQAKVSRDISNLKKEIEAAQLIDDIVLELNKKKDEKITTFHKLAREIEYEIRVRIDRKEIEEKLTRGTDTIKAYLSSSKHTPPLTAENFKVQWANIKKP